MKEQDEKLSLIQCTEGMMNRIFSNASEYQIETINLNSDTSTITLGLQHESGEESVSLIFSGVRKFEVEYPAYEIDSPFLIDGLTYALLEDDGSSYLEKIGYGHYNADGSIQTFLGKKGRLYRIRLTGDINIKLVFENIDFT